ncbi:MAG: hypothetical protein Q4D76_11510 [Oscillospiraceae bacterium]|nr:hypothetical protein [Oscillospiraceae bacterium]
MIRIKSILSSVIISGLGYSIILQPGPEKCQSNSGISSAPVISSCVNSYENTGYASETFTSSAPLTSAVTTVATTICLSETTTEATTSEPVITEPEIAETDITEQCVQDAVPVQGVICGEILNNKEYTEYSLPDNPNYHGFKSYEPYDLITAESIQLDLQREAVTDVNGFRLIDNRYLIAVGTFCNAPCGTCIDLILENGILIPCIVGDIKSDAHTDETHTYTINTMCASEFIVDETISPAAWYGDVSAVYEEWRSKVVRVRVYHHE